MLLLLQTIRRHNLSTPVANRKSKRNQVSCAGLSRLGVECPYRAGLVVTSRTVSVCVEGDVIDVCALNDPTDRCKACEKEKEEKEQKEEKEKDRCIRQKIIRLIILCPAYQR